MKHDASLRKSFTATTFEYWQDVVRSTILEGECDTPSRRGFQAEISTVRPGDTWFSHVRGSAQSFMRQPRHISRASGEYFVLLLQLGGTTLHCQDGREVILRPGSLVCNDTTRPFELQLSDQFEQIIVHVPRSIAVSMLGPTERITSRVYTRHSPVGSLLVPFLQQLTTALGEVSATTVQRLAHLARSLVLTSLAEWAGEALPERRWPAAMLSHRARALITAHAHEPTLNSMAIAQAIGISLRYLQELFRDEGITPGEYIWTCRLEKCRRELADPALARISISDIAARAGFSNLSHFSRRFGASFGQSPREFRMASLRNRVTLLASEPTALSPHTA